MDLLTELESLIPELEKGLDQASSLQEMEALRVEFLGRKGRIARIMSRLPELEPAQRPLLGQTANRVKESLTAQFEAKKTALDNAEEAAALARFDAGLPGRLPWRGSLHPVTMVMEEICTIFKGLGYDIVSGPEVERCLGMFSHTISLKTRNEEEWGEPELSGKTTGKHTSLCAIGASELRIYKAFSVC